MHESLSPSGRTPRRPVDQAIPETSLSGESFPDSKWRRRFRRRLLSWFERNARDLPWRRTQDPYRVWVSEIMLQQTQVSTVVDYFDRFLKAFPTIEALAHADQRDVLRAWEGLGYYRRARQLHRAAQLVVAEYGGRLPRDAEALRALPGIGRYTAGAIASIAWNAREPILEANTVRLFARLLAYRGDATSGTAGRLFWRFSEVLLPRKHVGAFNQALMELGSEICAPRSPRCDRCPVAELCPTRARGLVEAIPGPKRKTHYEAVVEAAVVVRRAGRVLLRRCGPKERWAGLWDFPRFSVTAARAEGRLAEVLRALVTRQTGVVVELAHQFATIKHTVTRFRITLLCYEATHVDGALSGDHLRWVAPSRLGEYPLSTTGRKIGQLLVRPNGPRVQRRTRR